MEKHLMDIKELSSYLKVKEKTIYQWTYVEYIPHYKTGGLLRFDLDEINNWLKEQAVPVL